jgi:hypothetical protein
MSVTTHPSASLSYEQKKKLGLFLLTLFILIFPYVHDNDGDIDSMANAAAYATLALGLNIVVGFAGLLDLGYAAFFAIGAYYYGILTSFQVMPLWSPGWAPLAAVGLVEKMNQGGPDLVHFTLSFWIALPTAALVAAFFGVLFGAPTHRDAGVWRDCADRGAQRRQCDQWRRRAERGAGAASVRPQLRGQRHAVLLCRHGDGGAAGVHQYSIAGFPYRPGLDGVARG